MKRFDLMSGDMRMHTCFMNTYNEAAIFFKKCYPKWGLLNIKEVPIKEIKDKYHICDLLGTQIIMKDNLKIFRLKYMSCYGVILEDESWKKEITVRMTDFIRNTVIL